MSNSSGEYVPLHFIGRSELMASLKHLPSHAWYSIARPMPEGWHDAFMRRLAIMDALRDVPMTPHMLPAEGR